MKRLLLPLLLLAALPAHAESTAPTAQGPEKVLSPSRAEIVLNGIWLFQPARGPAATTPQPGQWGAIRVPGVWDRVGFPLNFLPGPLALGSGGAWNGLKLETPNASFAGTVLPGVERAWYQREIQVPAGWSGRDIRLEVSRLSTDAKVLVDGRPVGEIHWPGGEVDLTTAVRPGVTSTLTLLVVATPDEGDVKTFMDADRPVTQRASLETRGLTGDVVLAARPLGAHLDGLFIKPSVRQKELLLDVDLAGEWPPGPYTLTASAREWPSGPEAKTWSLDVTLGNATTLRDLHLPWADPKLWDFLQPNLYTLEVALTPKGAAAPQDAISERFGFREFRISGRQFLLNEQPFNFRLRGFNFSGVAMPDDVLRRAMQTHIATGFNVGYDWPEPHANRGKPETRPEFARVADEVGLPVTAAVPEGDTFFDVMEADPPADRLAAWRAALETEWKKLRNHPSVLVLTFQGNRFSHGDDQNPHRIGQTKNLPLNPANDRDLAAPRKLLAAIKELDPTRPVTSHHSAIGDYHTSNNYLNMHPLQERQDWLSAWAKSGDVPFSAVEFDPPFPGTLNRGRNSHISESTTEPLVTEHSAAYFGLEAYTGEDAAYRAAIPGWFVSGQDYKGVSIGGTEGFQKFAPFWIRETWVPWRLWGISGGMWAWSDAHGWERAPGADNAYSLPAWQPGQRGPWVPQVLNRSVPFAPEAYTARPSGEALIAANSPTVAAIVGFEADSAEPGHGFTNHTHHVEAGATLTKQIGLLNDTRAPQPYTATVKVSLAGQLVMTKDFSGELPVGVPTFLPFDIATPAGDQRAEGRIELDAKIGSETHRDEFTFRVYPKPAPPAPGAGLLVWDPEGDTTKLLASLGYATRPWDGKPGAAALVVGRRALAKGTPPGDLAAFAAAGGTVVIAGQDPDWLRENTPFRTNRYVARRLWPVPTQTAHPILAGLDGEDFRDWSGAGTLVAPEKNTELVKTEKRFPEYGWRWGNRGSVASMMIEKPHRTAWTPLLEGEFDLAYTPLMERPHGRGRILWNGLDLEGRDDPAARLVARRIFDYARSARPAAATPRPVLIGAAGAPLAQAMGLLCVSGTALPAPGTLAVLGPDARVADSALGAFLDRGGHVLVLPRPAGKLPFGLVASAGIYGRQKSLPDWPELRGLSLSDVRVKTDATLPLITAPDKVRGIEVALEGGVARVTRGTGSAILWQLDPAALAAEEKTYYRYSSWRWTRALAQVAANLGGIFAQDAAPFRQTIQSTAEVSLAGEWKYLVEGTWPPAPNPTDVRIDQGPPSGLAKTYSQPGFRATDWKPVALPGELDRVDAQLKNKTWAVWLRKEIDVPAALAGQPLLLELGPIDDFEEVWLNGARIGATSSDTASWWALPRSYPVRPGFAVAGRNVVLVRLYNQFGTGGFNAASSRQMALRLKDAPEPEGPYVPGFRKDHPLGDDPARYYRW